jgi:cyclic pyranopterin phosphate synthase
MDFTHLDDEGRITMVDVGQKPVTERTATASGFVQMSPATVEAIKSHCTPKGDPLEAARLAGIMAAKKTADLIPLCHPLMLTQVDVELEIKKTGVAIASKVTTSAQTGVEMEALTAVAVAALTLYDMCKALDKSMKLTDIQLESKTGGRSGDYVRSEPINETKG